MIPYNTIDDYTLSVIKAPPLNEITVIHVLSGGLNLGITNDNIIGHIFQFSCRYVYYDGERSVWSVPSFLEPSLGYYAFNIYNPVIPITGMFGLDYHYDNLQLSLIPAVDSPTDIKEIEIAVRIDGGAWYYYDTFKRPFGGYDYDFFYNKILIQLADGEITIPYDYVPRLAKSQEIINKNIICYGDLLEGYNNPKNINVTLTPDVLPTDQFHLFLARQLPIATTTTSTTTTTIQGIYSPYDIWNTITCAQITFMGLNIVDVYWEAFDEVCANFVIYLMGDGVYHKIIYNEVEDWNVAAATEFATIISGDDFVTSANIVGGTTRIRIIFNVNVQDVGAIGLKYGNYLPVPSIKDYAKYYIGIEYIDKFGRIGTVLEDETMTVDVPSLNSYPVNYNDYTSIIKYSVNHTPPIWASKWRFCYGSNISWWMQYLVRPYHETDRSVFRDEETGLLKIKINEGINDVRDELHDYKLDNYVWEQGDRIRIVGTIQIRDNDVVHFPVDVIDTSIIGREIDYEIHSFDGIYIYITDFTQDDKFKGFTVPDIDSIGADDILVEIYRLKKDTESVIYKSIPQINEIINAGKHNRTHSNLVGIIQIQNERLCMMPMANLVSEEEPFTSSTTSTSSSTSTTSTYTTWIYDVPYAPGLKCCVAHVPYFGHKLNVQFEHLWDSKVNISDPNAKEIRVNKLRWGGQYIDDATINNVCKFLYDDQIRMPDKYGSIYGMREVGYTLKVLQQSKNTSIYIGREETVNADGTVSYVYVNSLFGNISPHIEEFGTIFPDSIVVSDRFMYFFDIYSGRVIRDAANGQMDIGFGEFKMQSYFRQKADALLADGVSNVNVIGGVDRENNMVYFTFLDSINNQNNETIGFHELTGRWKSFYLFIPECYGKLGENTFFSFKAGRPYIHNHNAPNRCTFYGVKYPQSIWLVSNINPQLVKQFNSLAIVSNKPWTLPNNGDVYITPNTTYPTGMSSKLRAGDFEEYEGEFRAAFLGDLFTGGGAANDIYLYTGRELKGREVLLKLTNSENTEVNLFIVKVNSSVSR